jgi:hypothetical protein
MSDFKIAMQEYREAIDKRAAATVRRQATYHVWYKAQYNRQLGLVTSDEEETAKRAHDDANKAEGFACAVEHAAQVQACVAAGRELQRLLDDPALVYLLPHLFGEMA